MLSLSTNFFFFFISANFDDIPYGISLYSDTSAYSKKKFQANRL